MSDVPSEIHLEILLRLPAISLFRFRTVCKSWRRIIDDPSFVRSHTTHVKNLYRRGVPRIASLPVVASCNGLILISHENRSKTWAIWNPLTADFHELPQPDVIESYQIGVGMGFDSSSDDYKIVRIGMIHNLCRTLIYSLKSKSWRMMSMNYPLNFIHPWGEGVYFNGAVHWISLPGTTIVALDLATEEYREFQSPPLESLPSNVRLDALDGCLVLSDELMSRAWMMRGYGTEEAIWVELFTANERSVICGVGSRWPWSPLAYSNSERRFIMHHENTIMRWDIEKRSVKRVTIDGLPDSVTSQVVPVERRWKRENGRSEKEEEL